MEREVTEALDDDLNAPRAVAALFSFVGAGNAAMDAGHAPGPKAVAAWEWAEGVLAVTTTRQAILITGRADLATAGGTVSGAGSVSPSMYSPRDPELAEKWATEWALRRRDLKKSRNFAEADRIRDRLKSAGWEVRDGRDGSVEVVRIVR